MQKLENAVAAKNTGAEVEGQNAANSGKIENNCIQKYRISDCQDSKFQ